MSTFTLRWDRRGRGSATILSDSHLGHGLARLREDPVSCWSRSSLAVWYFSEDPNFSLFEDPSGHVAIVAGRLDAFQELVHLVGATRSLGGSPTDARLVSAVFNKWGADGIDRLIGDFVAIVWDPREGSLLCARDRIGVAPLYYWESPDEVVVSGHIGGVLAHSAVKTTPNARYIADVLAVTFDSLTDTLYKDVWRLPAGHARRFLRTASRSWQWASEHADDRNRLRPAEADERYRELLSLAIRDRMRRPGRLGTDLSGGLDSSTVASLAAPLAKEPYGEEVRSYSLVFPGLECDETPYITQTAKHCGLNSTMVHATMTEGGSWRDEQRATRDLPLAPNLVAWRAIKSAARAHGLGALLTGMGGDQGFDITAMAAMEPLLGLRLRQASGAARVLYPEVKTLQRLTRVLRPTVANRVRTIFPSVRPQPVPEWLDAKFARESGLEECLASPPRPPATARGDRLRMYRSGWESYVFEANSVFGALTGVPSVHPFYDARVVAFALSLDERHRWDGYGARTIQRRAMVDRLPGAVVQRGSKAEFGHLFVEEFQRAGGRSAFEGLLIARECRWARSEVLVRLHDAMEARTRNGTGWIWPLWMALALERWYRSLREAW